jgi:hypothetical protein
MYSGWNPQKGDFAEGHFAEVSISGHSLEHDTGVYEVMRQAVLAFIKHETKTQAGCH